MALSRIARRICFSSAAFLFMSPRGYGMATAGTMRFAPTVCEIGTIVQICTTGIPNASIALTIVAPQRVQVPQVEVRITASTPSFFSCSPMAVPNFFALAIDVPLPTVVEKYR